MNELIKIEAREISGATVQTCNARTLWEFVESKQEFANWIKGRIEKYAFVEGEDFTVEKFINGRATIIDYHLTIETAKELAMVENNEKGREVRRYFIECERMALRSAQEAALARFNVPATYPEAMRLAADLAEQKAHVEAKLALAAPKAEALDRIATFSDGSFCIRDAAKMLQVQEKVLRTYLHAHCWWFPSPAGGEWRAYSNTLKRGLMEHKHTEGDKTDGTGKWSSIQVRITAKGLTRLSEIFSEREAA